MAILRNWWVRYTVALLVIFGCHLSYGGYFYKIPISTMPSDSDPERIKLWIKSVWDGKTVTEVDPLLTQSGLCWIQGYAGGNQEIHELSLFERRASACARMLSNPGLSEMEAIEIGIATNSTLYNHEVIEQEKTGLWGIVLRCGGGDLCLTPSDFPRRSEFPDGQSIKYQSERTVYKQAKFQALTWVLRHDKKYQPSPIVRGESLVPLQSINQQTISGAAQQLADYQQRTLKRQHGLLPYTYSVASGKASEEERNLVKTCLGSLSLANWARYTGRDEDRQISQRYLRTMIARYGHQVDDKAYVADSDSAFLGAQCLFALALRGQPQPDTVSKDFEKQLARGIVVSLDPNGRFRSSFLLPGSPEPEAVDPEKDENQNVFPGMALTYLASRCQATSPPISKGILDQVLQYYLNRFKRYPNKSAIPWLTEAFRQRFVIDRNRAAAEDAFSLVDWNLDNLQEWDKMDPQARGGSINPDRPQYGPSCFTYDVAGQLQSLVAADWLAQELGEAQRHQRYATAILEMSRYLRQVQYREKGDLYWLPTNLREAPLGGMRDALWNSTMEVDSSAGALNAWTEWLISRKHH